ncbi:inhibitor of apoptosis-promoting Bax1-domain-containing protein [Abortiporus biennis]|nr:inhibitor of apoptosis-promoting Bax1-domain-containing protein [Abortiporus biennis]
MASNYTAPPPAYRDDPQNKLSSVPPEDEAARPLLSPTAGPSAGGFYDQPAEGDLPDDFKYGTCVADSAPEIRNAFVRKVYSILFVQILATSIVAGIISQSDSALTWIIMNTWSVWVSMIGTFVCLGVLYWKRHSYPTNFIFLSLFTVLEAFSLGLIVAFYRNVIVLQALLITLGVFLGLTLFTFQSKYDFSGMGPWLFGGLVALVMTGFVGMIIPFGQTMDLLYAIGGTLLFSGYIVYDTYTINKRLSPDEYIMASISLYLDFINLFINILRLLNNAQDR